MFWHNYYGRIRGFWPDRSHAPYSKRPASANACRKIDKNSNRSAVAFLLREVANQLWTLACSGLGIDVIFEAPQLHLCGKELD
ncbi:hypothetical protein BQ8794_80083 [Mesorhizobium prunaredense]|uniref:Uncharacterized protein n=1 Tax=Mesorhizobium prunaredense TaxID=1631249 RepID=A0A1R3VIJ6_9HYPH|nr:hypothetical protein BQ8794_80083 [Mesorhizobium prunaredense]